MRWLLLPSPLPPSARTSPALPNPLLLAGFLITKLGVGVGGGSGVGAGRGRWVDTRALALSPQGEQRLGWAVAPSSLILVVFLAPLQ